MFGVAGAGPRLGDPIALDALPGFQAADGLTAFRSFVASCKAIEDGTKPSRVARPPPDELRAVCAVARTSEARIDAAAAKRFFASAFVARRVIGDAFFTGYYEPVVEGSLVPTAEFATPLLAPPAASRKTDGTSAPMPDRAAIEAGALGDDAKPLVYLRDRVEAFFVQVQGSARVTLPDGTSRRLAYAGRNGYPYTSIGKVLVDTLHIPPAEMGMAQLKAWIRAHGQQPREAGAELMQRNRSYIFFRFDDTLPGDVGPRGGEGVGLSALRSLAIDRSVWSYGLPFYVDAVMPWRGQAPELFQRLMIAQDTGSAILGPARADIFFGSGPAAAVRAGAIRHPGVLYVLWPKAAKSAKPTNEDAGR